MGQVRLYGNNRRQDCKQRGVSFSGYSLHGYLWIVFILSLAVIAFLVAKAGFATMPFVLPVTQDQALLVATGISFVLS